MTTLTICFLNMSYIYVLYLWPKAQVHVADFFYHLKLNFSGVLLLVLTIQVKTKSNTYWSQL